MATNIRITHITKPDNANHHAHITKIWSGDGAHWTLSEAIASIEQKIFNFYVKDSYGETAYVGVVPASASNIKHIRTYADGEWNDNLLSLPRK